MKTRIAGGAIVIFATLFLSFAQQARADATVYWDFDNGLDPNTVIIGPSETVTWWNVDPFGFDVRMTFDNGFTFFLRNGHGQGVIFPSTPGIYGYHTDWGENGAVIVNVPPSVAITNPPANTVLSAPTTFAIQATVSETPDDYVSDVEFFLGTNDSTNSIEDVFTEPFATGLTNLDAGTYTLIAVARDSRGWTATNSINITVGQSAAVTISSPRISGGKFLFDVSGLMPGKTNIVQASTNLSSWTALNTNVAAAASMTVTNTANLNRRFYRILQLP